MPIGQAGVQQNHHVLCHHLGLERFLESLLGIERLFDIVE
jgi:hypothetical protein